MRPAPTDEQIQRLKKQLLKKGAEINEKLTKLLNSQKPDATGLSSFGPSKPGETPIERLRRFMRLVDGQLVAIRAGTYGRCVGCSDGLPYEHLEQVPWIDTCQACAAKAAEEAS